MKVIYLTQGQKTFVDDEDLESLRKWKWHAVKTDSGRFYAGRNPGRGGRSKFVSMHRFIMRAKKGFEVDHVDGNSLNNQKSNLRCCTRSENMFNHRKLPKSNRSGFFGVSWNSQNKWWYATTVINRKQTVFGKFKTPIEAAICYDKNIVQLKKEFATTNKSLGLL